MLRGDALTGRADYRQETCFPTSAKSTEFASKWRTHHQSGGEQRDHGIAGIDRRWEPRLSFTRDVRSGRAYGKCRINDGDTIGISATEKILVHLIRSNHFDQAPVIFATLENIQ